MVRTMKPEPLDGSGARRLAVVHSERAFVLSAMEHGGPFLILALSVGFGLYVLHAETSVVAYLNDEAFHRGMVQLASSLLRTGRDPLSAWYPLLNLGSPEFLHYQSLPAIITGAIGILVGVPHAFAWSTYLLLATWPLSTSFA